MSRVTGFDAALKSASDKVIDEMVSSLQQEVDKSRKAAISRVDEVYSELTSELSSVSNKTSSASELRKHALMLEVLEAARADIYFKINDISYIDLSGWQRDGDKFTYVPFLDRQKKARF